MISPVAAGIEQWPIERLVAYSRNPRKNDGAVDRMLSQGIRAPTGPRRLNSYPASRWRKFGTLVNSHARFSMGCCASDSSTINKSYGTRAVPS